MASPGGESQPTWIPYETIKDCSQGFCSIYCPQWCYIIFPPPPPPGLSSSSEDPSSSSSSSSAGAALSPLVIAVIGILASALLLVAYYAVICKYCTRIDALRRRLQGRDASSSPGRDVDAPGPWFAPAAAASGGLDEGAIKSIGQFRYRTGEGPVEEGGDCSVCLGEFRDGEGLRLLPKCGHAFHVACIDHWLRSHPSCPLCRAAVVSPCAQQALFPSAAPPPPTAPPEDAVVADDVAESGSSREGEASGHGGLEQAAPVAKWGALNRGDHIVLELFGDGDGAQPIRRSFSMGASRLSRVCVADVLGPDMETAVDDEGMGSTSKGCCRTGQDAGQEDDRAHRRPQYHEAGPGAMKRSFSSGRFCWQGKVSHGGIHESILPI